MKERNWEALAQELIELIGNSTEATAVEVKVENNAIELHPKKGNDGTAFSHTEEVVDFCRCKKLSNYVSFDFYSRNVICRIH